MLEYLSLGSNKIGDDGAIALSNSLPRSLRELWLYIGNQIGLEGCNELMKFLVSSYNSLRKVGHPIPPRTY